MERNKKLSAFGTHYGEHKTYIEWVNDRYGREWLVLNPECKTCREQQDTALQLRMVELTRIREDEICEADKHLEGVIEEKLQEVQQEMKDTRD